MIAVMAMISHIQERPNFSAYVMGAAMIVIILSALSLGDYTITAYATSTQSTKANVSITGYIAIALSNNLSGGIDFGVITTLPSTQINATYNYDNSFYNASVPDNDLNLSLYNASVSTDSNQNADFCVRGSGPFATDGGTQDFALANMTWVDNASIHNLTSPPGGIWRGYFGRTMTTSYTKGEINIQPDNETIYRFWLNVSAAQAVGDYNTTINFRGVTTGDACGS